MPSIVTKNIQDANLDPVTTAAPAVAFSEPTPQPPSTAGMTTKVVKGSLWTLAGQVAPLAVSVVTASLVIRMLGAEGYGVLVLVGVIPSYLAFADFGMAYASTKYASDAYAKGDADLEARIVRTAAFITFLSSLPLALALFALSGQVVEIFNVPAAFVPEASLALKIASLSFVLNFLNNVLNTPQLTRMRMDLNSLIASVPKVIGLIANPIVLFMGGGIVGLSVVLLVVTATILIGHLYCSSRLMPTLLGTRLEPSIVRPLLRFGGGLAAASIAAMVLLNAEKGILPQVVSVQALAYYSVAYTLATMFTIFTGSLMQSLLPAFSQLQSKEATNERITLYSRALRMNLVMTLPVVVGLGIVAEPFFTLWAGEEFGRQSTGPFYLLMVGLVFNVQACLPGTAILAAGRSDIFTKLYWIELVPYLALLWLLATRMGINGVAIAWSVRIAIDAIAQFYFAHRVSGVNVAGCNFKAFAAGVAVLLLPLLIGLYSGGIGYILILFVLVCFAIYSLIVWKWFLKADEVAWISEKFSSVFSRHFPFVKAL